MCIFCAIVARKAPAHIVYEDEHTMAFLDIAPIFPGHTLVVPKYHAVTLPDLPTHLLQPLTATVQLLTEKVQQAMGSQGIFVMQNNIVSQTVHHVHFHVVPRNHTDGFTGFFSSHQRYRNQQHKTQTHQAIINAIQRKITSNT